MDIYASGSDGDEQQNTEMDQNVEVDPEDPFRLIDGGDHKFVGEKDEDAIGRQEQNKLTTGLVC